MNPATNRPPIVRRPLLNALLQSPKTTQRIEIKEINFAPGQTTGLHSHPCPVVGYVATGSVAFQAEGEAEQTLSTGDAFFEPPGKRIVRFDNASPTEPMTFIAFYLLGENDHELIHMLD